MRFALQNGLDQAARTGTAIRLLVANGGSQISSRQPVLFGWHTAWIVLFYQKW